MTRKRTPREMVEALNHRCARENCFNPRNGGFVGTPLEPFCHNCQSCSQKKGTVEQRAAWLRSKPKRPKGPKDQCERRGCKHPKVKHFNADYFTGLCQPCLNTVYRRVERRNSTVDAEVERIKRNPKRPA